MHRSCRSLIKESCSAKINIRFLLSLCFNGHSTIVSCNICSMNISSSNATSMTLSGLFEESIYCNRPDHLNPKPFFSCMLRKTELCYNLMKVLTKKSTDCQVRMIELVNLRRKILRNQGGH